MKTKKKSWIVRMECKVTKDVYCENCTEKQAGDVPFDYAVQEEEVDQLDWRVIKVRENA